MAMEQNNEIVKSIQATNEAIQKVVENIKRYAPQSITTINTFRGQVAQLCELKVELDQTKPILQNLDTLLNENPNLELRKMFMTQIRSIEKPHNYNEHVYMQQFDKVLNASAQCIGEEETDASQQLVDPFTKQPIKQAVRNKICGHIYDHNSIEDIFTQQHQLPRCPIVGCPNKKKISKRYLEKTEIDCATQAESVTLEES